nr:DUF4347 domain-containing protein [Nostoc sp. DedQUE07]MDZ8131330.1 DUF4347 domain-containing protein [Nostoc sp. DedQUE07]
MTTVSLAPQPNFSIGYNSNLDRIYKYQQLQLRLIECEALVIFDSRVEDLEILYAALSPKALGYTLTLEDDALVVITNLIAQTKAKRLAIVAHGTPGVLQIGALPINRQEIKKQAQLLQQWNVAEIALYSCQVGKDAEFISELAQLTKAEIFAAAGKVGAPTQGGSWQLDIQSDRGKMKPPLTANGLAKYPGVLASPIALNLNSTSNTQLLREPSGQRSGITDGHTYKQLFAFAALKEDGSVVTWGNSTYGGDSSSVTGQLASGVTNISSTYYAFAALKEDGSVVTWGDSGFGGNSSAVSSQLTSGVTNIFSTHIAFAALKSDGSVVTWGNSEYGGDSSLVSSQLASGVINISSPFDTIGLIVAENSPTNTAIGTFSGVDPDPEDTITYSLVSGTGSTDNDSFTINGNQLLINASPDFEAKSSYSIRVRITDQTNLSYEKAFTIKITDVNETPPTPVVDIKLINSINDIFEIDASEFTKVNIKIKIKGHSSKLVNEIGVFSVDDSLGTIDGIAPDAAGYQEKALSRAKIIFSVLANNPTGFNPEDLSRILDLQGGTQLRFYLKSQGNIIFSDTTTQKITSENEGGFTLGWKDGSRGDSVFDDLQVNIQQTDEQLPIGTSLQGKSEGEALDLRNFATDSLISGTFIVNREASYNNFVGFYKVTDTDGGIDTNGDGTADILPGQAGYVQAAINERVSDIALSVGNQGTGNYNGNFQGGSIYVPFLIVDSGVNALLDSNSSNDPTVYFTFLGANADKTQHVKMLGDNIFGFEDLSGGGDKDYNDVIVKINLTHNIA